MADEQTPQSDLIDDAIRQAERQLEAKLDALRMSALGDGGTRGRADEEPAILAPTNPTSRSTRTRRDPGGGVTWRETGGNDVTFAPLEASVDPYGDGDLYLPEPEESFDELPHELQPHEEPAAQAHPAHEALSTSVTDLTTVWEAVDDAPASDEPSRESRPSEREARPSTHRSSRRPREEAEASPAGSERPGPERAAAWSEGSASSSDAGRPLDVASVPGPDELEFWAHTRTALRTLHQIADSIPEDVTEQVTGQVQRILEERVAPTDATLRQVQEQLQQQLPRLQERLEQAIAQAATGPTNGVRQIRDELPAQLDRSARELRTAIREELESSGASVHGAVQRDVAQLEQSIASNVTRMTQGTTEAVGRVERDVDLLGESVVRFERGVSGDFDRIETQLRAAIERVEQGVRAEIAEPAEAVRRLEEDLPSRLGGVEAAVLQQLQATQRELSTVMTSLVDANRASLDRIAAVASTIDEDRLRRGDEAELIVDTVTTGWEGLANAMKALFAQQEQNSKRISGIEERLAQIRNLEETVAATLGEFRDHVRDLKPAPVVVTVAHAEAEVQNTSRSGWLPTNRS